MLVQMEFLINQILEKNDIKNENLAKALAEIFNEYYQLSLQKFVLEYDLNKLKEGLH
ncbi:hypothetical protein [Lysinibacillus fusiformis]